MSSECFEGIDEGGSGETHRLSVHSEVCLLRYPCCVVCIVLQSLELFLILNKEVFVDNFQCFLGRWAAFLVQAGIDVLEGVPVRSFQFANIRWEHIRHIFHVDNLPDFLLG